MSRIQLFVLSTVATLSTLQAPAQLFSENFNSQTVGANPTGFTQVSPGSATPGTLGVTVANVGIGNNALNLYDNSSTGAARAEKDFTPGSAIRLSLSFTRNANISPSATTAGLYVTLGTFGLAQNTSANRALDIRLFNDGTYRFERGVQNNDGTFASSSLTGSGTFEPAGTTYLTHTLDIFAFSGVTGGSTFAYLGPDNAGRQLDPKSYAVYLDGVLVTPSGTGLTANGNYGFYNSPFYGAGGDLGRFGLVTGGSSTLTGFDFLVDDISISTITVPEPASSSVILLGALLLAARRRISGV